MVVALGATNGHAVKAGADDLDRIGDGCISSRHIVHGTGAIGSHAQETRGHQFVDGIRAEVSVRLRHHFIARQLLAHELIKRLVQVEGLHHVIAVLVGVLTLQVAVRVAIAIGVTCHVEPMPAPAFAIGRRIQQTIEQLLHRQLRILDAGGRIGLDFFWCWRQACEVKRSAADVGDRIGFA